MTLDQALATGLLFVLTMVIPLFILIHTVGLI